MDEEGITATENSKIHIGRPLNIDAEALRTQLKELWDIVSVNDREDDEMMRLVEEKLHEITPTFNRACAVEAAE